MIDVQLHRIFFTNRRYGDLVEDAVRLSQQVEELKASNTRRHVTILVLGGLLALRMVARFV